MVKLIIEIEVSEDAIARECQMEQVTRVEFIREIGESFKCGMLDGLPEGIEAKLDIVDPPRLSHLLNSRTMTDSQFLYQVMLKVNERWTKSAPSLAELLEATGALVKIIEANGDVTEARDKCVALAAVSLRFAVERIGHHETF